MGSRVILQFSPLEVESVSSPPQRQIQPSLEKKCLVCTTFILSKRAEVANTPSGSPGKKRKGEPDLVPGMNPFPDTIDMLIDNQIVSHFDIKLGEQSKATTALHEALATSKRIELDHPFVENGRICGPINLNDLLHLFPTTRGVNVGSFVTFWVQTLPPKPWLLSIGGLPVHFSTSKHDSCFDPGESAKGPRILNHINLQSQRYFSYDILREVVDALQGIKTIKLISVFWLTGIWQITIAERVDRKVLPSFICSNAAFYKFASEIAYPDPSVLREKAPQGTEFDNSLYVTSLNALLRPGIILGSSAVRGVGDSKLCYKQTSSGILVKDQQGSLFITVASHGFEDDGLVYHPDPDTGVIIGKIVKDLPGTGISLAKLNPGLRYVNETFRTSGHPLGIQVDGISPGHSPQLRSFDTISMNNPFSGDCGGLVFGLGCIIPEDSDHDYVQHQWIILEDGDEPVDKSCGSPIIDANGQVVGLFRYKMPNSRDCFAVSAQTLWDYGYEICVGEHTFQDRDTTCVVS